MASNCRADRQLPPQHGIALVGVLWLLVLLALIATNLSLISRSETHLAGNLVNAARANHAADAGIEWALWQLLQPPAQAWLADGELHRMELDGMTVRVALYDEIGKFDLNLIETPQLLLLFESVGVDDDKAEALADAILDWRDEDDLKRLHGAEDEDYEDAGYREGAKDAPFDTVAELRRVYGMEEAIYRAIRPALTVYSNNRSINPQVAPRQVLMALPEATPALVEQYIEERRRNHADGLPAPPPPELNANFLASTTRGLNYTVVTEAEAAPGSRTRLELVVRRRGGILNGGFEVLQQTRDTELWTEGADL